MSYESQPLTNQHLTNRNILVIEQNQHSRKAIRYYLNKVGVEIYEASNLLEAIAILDTGKNIDATLIDWRLTGFDGVEFAQTIFSNPQFANLPLIAILTADRQDEIQAIVNHGFCAHLTKPFKAKRLLKAISFALGIEASSLMRDPVPSSLAIANIKENTNENFNVDKLHNLKILLSEDNIVIVKFISTPIKSLPGLTP